MVRVRVNPFLRGRKPTAIELAKERAAQEPLLRQDPRVRRMRAAAVLALIGVAAGMPTGIHYRQEMGMARAAAAVRAQEYGQRQQLERVLKKAQVRNLGYWSRQVSRVNREFNTLAPDRGQLTSDDIRLLEKALGKYDPSILNPLVRACGKLYGTDFERPEAQARLRDAFGFELSPVLDNITRMSNMRDYEVFDKLLQANAAPSLFEKFAWLGMSNPGKYEFFEPFERWDSKRQKSVPNR